MSQNKGATQKGNDHGAGKGNNPQTLKDSGAQRNWPSKHEGQKSGGNRDNNPPKHAK